MAAITSSAVLPVRAVAQRSVARRSATKAAAPVAGARSALFGPKVAAQRAPVCSARGRSQLVVKAEDDGFDSLLTKGAEAFEKSDKKVPIVGWGVAALLAFFFTEWLIHLPGLNILLGFPLELVGVLVGPVLGLRYLKNGKSITDDVTSVVEEVADILPGLK